jgi:hypothetical protein
MIKKLIVFTIGYLIIGFVISVAHFIALVIYNKRLGEYIDKHGVMPDNSFFDHFIELGEIPALSMLCWPITIVELFACTILWMCTKLNNGLIRVCRSIVDWEFEHKRKKNV